VSVVVSDTPSHTVSDTLSSTSIGLLVGFGAVGVPILIAVLLFLSQRRSAKTGFGEVGDY
jgi:hypothetical protein